MDTPKKSSQPDTTPPQAEDVYLIPVQDRVAEAEANGGHVDFNARSGPAPVAAETDRPDPNQASPLKEKAKRIATATGASALLLTAVIAIGLDTAAENKKNAAKDPAPDSIELTR